MVLKEGLSAAFKIWIDISDARKMGTKPFYPKSNSHAN